MMNIKELRKKTNMTQKEFADKYNIPVRTIQKWERNGSTPPDYIVELIENNMFLETTELFMECYWKNEKTATVRLDDKYAYIKRYITHPVKQIFYADKISRFEFGEILEDRCWDKHRPDINKIIELLGLDEYNPYEICKRTHGRMYQDNIWFRFPGEILCYEDLEYTMRYVGAMPDMKNANKYITINENCDEEEGHMCKALEDIFEDGRIEGRAEGRAEVQVMIDKLKEELAAAKAEIEKLKMSKSGNS